jgi:CheY-like chemotaxis protein
MSKTLLLADDSVTIQRVIELSFAHEDVRVVSVSDGRRAIQYIDTERPDIVVVDIGVPDVDGYAVSSHVKESSALKHTPVILLAGAFEPVDDSRARSSGCDAVLVKPFEPQQLVGKVKELLTSAERWAPARTPASVGATSPTSPAPTATLKALADAPLRPVHNPPQPSAAPVFASAPVAAAPLTGTLPEFRSVAQPPRFGIDPGIGAGPSTASHMFATAEPLELPPEPIWHTPLNAAVAEPVAPAPQPKVSLANAFSALLAAEQTQAPPAARIAPPEIPEAAIEEAVRRILSRMTGEAVRQVVLDTAERLIREEIEKIKASHSE